MVKKSFQRDLKASPGETKNEKVDIKNIPICLVFHFFYTSLSNVLKTADIFGHRIPNNIQKPVF